MKILLSFLMFFLLSYAISATDPSMVYSLVKEGKAVIVDVREKDEIKSGMIDKAIWFPKSKMTSDPNWKEDFLKLTKDKKVFLYCRSGKRAKDCQEILQKNGIEAENIGGYEQLKTVLPTTIPQG